MGAIRVGVARNTARGVIKKYGITSPPTDVDSIAVQEGLTVKVIHTWPPKMSGLLLREELLIGINGNHSRRRRRFSLAHELGHWFMRHDVPWHDPDVTIDNPPQLAGYRKDPTEGEADEFAGELLAPLAMLKAAMKDSNDPGSLADVFDISEPALWVRLVKHRLF